MSTIRPNCGKVSHSLQNRMPRWVCKPYPLVDRDQNACLCMLRGQYIAVDSHSPALISSQFDITIDTINEGGKLRTKEKDVDTAEGGYAVDGVGHGLLERAGIEVGHHFTVDIYRSATLLRVSQLLGCPLQNAVCWVGRLHTSDRGVSLRIFSRVCQTKSWEPERQTVVT